MNREQAYSEKVNVPDVKALKHHELIRQNNHAVCISCPYRHTIPVDWSKYDVENGTLVKKHT